MESKLLSFSYSSIRMDFELYDDKDISLVYCGKDDGESFIKDKVIRKLAKFVEIEYIGGTENKHRGHKNIDTTYGKTYKYVSHTFKTNKLGKELVIVTKNDVLEVETHYQFYSQIKAVSAFNKVKNISNNDVKLTSVSSFYQLGILPSDYKNNYLYRAINSWHCEAQWSKFSFLDLGIYTGNNGQSMKRYMLNNTGSWSTKDYLPMTVIENGQFAELVQIENNGSWHIEVADNYDLISIFASGPEFFDNQWMKVIKPNEEFVSVQATLTFGKDFEETIQEITKERRVVRRKNKDDEELPVIFNDYMHALWDTQTTELVLPLVDLAKELNCDEFCMDAGWFDKGSDWWNRLGVWEEYKDNFPNGGLKAVINYIKSKGMKAGIWIEIEAVGVNSSILKDIKEGWLFRCGGVDTVNTERYQLNFANPEVYNYAMSVIDNLMKLYELDYLKIDYNTEAGVGNEWNTDSLGDGLLKHNRAFIKWLNEVMDKYPNLTVENCASGGCRMDPEMLKVCPIQSTSDQTNYRKYPYLAANVLTACTPEQAAVWSYPLNDYEKIMPTDEVVAMNMCNAMLGRIHLASFINKLPESQKELIREGINYYRSISEMKKRSVPVYPKGTAKFFDEEVIGGIMDDKTLVLGVWNTSGKPRSIIVNLSKYGVFDVKIGYPTSLITNYKFDEKSQILEVTFQEDYGGRIIEFSRK